MPHWLTDPGTSEFWVLITFIIFMGIVFYLRVPALIGKALDKRAEEIRSELDQARRLREEAQQLLADYQRKAREAEEEAKIIVEQAKHEAETLAAETKKALSENLARRTKLAEEKIARAGAQALSEVRTSAVAAAVSAAEKLLKERVAGNVAKGLIDTSISDLKGKLN
jgi:F-type H+-transporting ATPase subunit b